MSWDVVLVNAPQGLTVQEIPRDFVPPPLGPATELLDRLRAALPDLNLSDPTWGNLDSPDWSIEFNIGREDPVESIMLHVRGGGDVVEVIQRAARALGCRALDGSSGEFIEDGGADGWADFQAYRDSLPWV